MTKMKILTNNFVQLEGESFYEAWTDIKCSYKSSHIIVYHFYNGLIGTTRTFLDALAGGALMRKSEDKAYQLLENRAINKCQWPSERVTPKKLMGMYEVDIFSNLAARVSLLTKQLQAT